RAIGAVSAFNKPSRTAYNHWARRAGRPLGEPPAGRSGRMSMRALLLPFTPRFIALTLCIAATALLAGLLYIHPPTLYGVSVRPAFVGGRPAPGVRDLLQARHSILRNYPISAHLRFLLEDIRPELRQYFFEGEKDGAPFSRDKRAVVYQRAKRALDK